MTDSLLSFFHCFFHRSCPVIAFLGTPMQVIVVHVLHVLTCNELVSIQSVNLKKYQNKRYFAITRPSLKNTFTQHWDDLCYSSSRDNTFLNNVVIWHDPAWVSWDYNFLNQSSRSPETTFHFSTTFKARHMKPLELELLAWDLSLPVCLWFSQDTHWTQKPSLILYVHFERRTFKRELTDAIPLHDGFHHINFTLHELL